MMRKLLVGLIGVVALGLVGTGQSFLCPEDDLELCRTGFYFIGVQIVPHPYVGLTDDWCPGDPWVGYMVDSNGCPPQYPVAPTVIGVPYLRFGYEHYLQNQVVLRSAFGMSHLLTPFQSWYHLDVGGKYLLTEQLGILVGLDIWALVEAFSFHTGFWSWGLHVGGHYGFGGRGSGLGVFITGHIPFFDWNAGGGVPYDAPLFAMFLSGGIEFRF